jgi:hypothetical protein
MCERQNYQWRTVALITVIMLTVGIGKAELTLITEDKELTALDHYYGIKIVDSWESQTVVDIRESYLSQVETYDTALLNMYSGGISILDAYVLSSVRVHNGDILSARIWNRSTLDLYGGSIGWLTAWDYSVINMYGYGFAYSPGECIGIPGCIGNGGKISGYWQDGTAFDILLNDVAGNRTYDHLVFHEIPEPASLLLLGLGGLWLRRRNCR